MKGLFHKNSISRLRVNVLTVYSRYFQTKLYCYSTKSRRYKYDEVYPINVAFSIQQLSEVSCDVDFRHTAIKRFSQGHRLFYCCDKNVIIAYGWLSSNTTTYYAWEIANYIVFSRPVVILYDSYVDPSYRCRGIQKSLIHSRINSCKEATPLIVYAESSNTPSIKAITHCGFSFVAKLTHFSNKIIL